MSLVGALGGVYRVAASPLGMRALARAEREGLPGSCVAALRCAFGESLSPEESEAARIIEQIRHEIAHSPERFSVLDTGRGSAERTGRQIAHRSSVPRLWGTVLMKLAKGSKARAILELGSCAGISTCYLAASHARVVGVEGSETLSALADEHVRRVSGTAQVVQARFDDVLDHLDEVIGRPGLVYIDGEHTRTARLHYLDRVLPHLDPGALVVFDDIHLSDELWQAWGESQQRAGIAAAVNLGRFGVCVCGPETPTRRFDFSRYTGWLRIGSARWKT